MSPLQPSTRIAHETSQVEESFEDAREHQGEEETQDNNVDPTKSKRRLFDQPKKTEKFNQTGEAEPMATGATRMPPADLRTPIAPPVSMGNPASTPRSTSATASPTRQFRSPSPRMHSVGFGLSRFCKPEALAAI